MTSVTLRQGGWSLLILCLSLTARAEVDGGWELVVSGPPITVRQRPVEGLKVNELLAEGHLAAPVQDLASTLTATPDFPKFMPYVKDSRFVGEEVDAEGYRLTWAEVDMPVVGKRDYVLRVKVLETVKPDGSGNFRNTFVAAPDAVPEKAGVTRIRTDSGGWELSPDADGTGTNAKYRLLVDPGGWIPAFAVNLGTRSGLPDTFRAVEKEAKRRRDERLRLGGARTADGGVPAADAGALAP